MVVKILHRRATCFHQSVMKSEIYMFLFSPCASFQL